MYLVDEIDLVTSLGRRISNVLAELSHIFHAVITGTINLDHIETVARCDLAAVVALATWRDGWSVHAIEGLCQNPRGRSLADTAWTNKKISMSQAVLPDRVLQGTRDMCLADQIVERLRPIFSGKNFVTHSVNLIEKLLVGS